MSAIYSSTEQTAAMAAGNAAANGAKEAAFLSSWQTAIGSNGKVVLYRDAVSVWSSTLTGTVPISGSAFVITAVSQVSISAADIDTGAWELRVEKAADAAVYFGCTVARAETVGTVGELNGDLPSSGTLTLGTLTFNAPDMDTVLPAAEQVETIVSGSNVGSLTLTLTTQPTAANKVLIPFAFYEGFRGKTDPTSVSATLWIDLEDLSTLKPNTDGTGTITGVDQVVKRIGNKGSAGGYFTNSSGWYLREATNGAYYLEMTGTSEFVSNIASSAIISVAAGEVIAACRPTTYSDGGDSWYSPSVWQADDGCAGVSLKSATLAEVFNLDTTDDSITPTQVDGADQLFTWRHTGGVLSGAVGFNSDPGTTVSSGNTNSLANGFALGGVYHGSFPRLTGRFYGIVATSTALSTTNRDFVQRFLDRKMTPVATLAPPSCIDNANNAYVVIESKADAANKLLSGVVACHNVTPGSGTFTATLNFGGSKGYYAAAVMSEWSEMVGATAVDVTGTATNDGSAGSLAVSTSATAQAVELALSVHALYNDDADANMVTPSGYTSLGVLDTASTVLGFRAAYKVVESIGTQSATGTWDVHSAGGAAAVLVTLKAGTSEEEPPSGGSGLTLNGMSSDMNSNVEHEYYLHGVPSEWDWGHTSKIGSGANPPGAYPDPHWVPWGIAATGQGYTPGSHNWRCAIVGIHSFKKVSGQWSLQHTAVTAPGNIDGAEYTDYETNTTQAATIYTGNGMEEVFLDNDGSSYHFYPDSRTAVDTCEERVVIVTASLKLIDDGGADERSAAEVVVMGAADFYTTATSEWPNNTESIIGRATKPASWPTISYHTAHTMTSDAAINEFIAWVEAEGVFA